MEAAGFIIGLLFGAALVLSGLADPDKIVGALRLKDLHAFRVTLLAVLTAMVGTYLMQTIHTPRLHLTLDYFVAVLIGGALVGTGVGMSGFCPATALAAWAPVAPMRWSARPGCWPAACSICCCIARLPCRSKTGGVQSGHARQRNGDPEPGVDFDVRHRRRLDAQRPGQTPLTEGLRASVSAWFA